MLPIANVAILHLVLPSDLLVLARSLDTRLVAVLLDIVDAEHLSTDKLLLEIGMDNPRSLGRLQPLSKRPSAHLVGTGGEVSHEIETVVAGLGDLAESAGDVVAQSGEFGRFGFGRAELEESLFERNGEGDEKVAWVVLVDPGFDLGEPLVLASHVVLFGEVDEVDDRLGGEQLEVVDDFDLRIRTR